MAGVYQKPDSERVTRHKTGFDWTDLPHKNENPIPPVPPGIDWTQRAINTWNELWESPQSTMWVGALRQTVEKWLGLYDRFWGSQGYVDTSASVINGMTQCEDRLGLSPKAMLQLRWRVRPAPAEENSEPIQLAGKSKRADLRKAV